MPEAVSRFAALNDVPSQSPIEEPQSASITHKLRTIDRPDDQTTGRPKGKRSHPDYEKVGLYLHSERRKRAERRWEDEGQGDFSDLIDKLLTSYLGDR